MAGSSRLYRRSPGASTLVLVAAILAALAWSAPASARADRYAGNVKAVASGPYGKLAKLYGTAHMTVVPGFSQLTIDLKRLAPDATFEFSLRQAASAGNPCQASSGAASATPVPDWSFFPFVANSQGNGHGVGRSNSFVPTPDATYYVDVRQPGGDELACGTLKHTGSTRTPRPKTPKPHATPRPRRQHGQRRGQGRRQHRR